MVASRCDLPRLRQSRSGADARLQLEATLTGKNLYGTKNVQLRGVTAAFMIASATKIYTSVPVGVAGLAKWTVTTPGGTATSAFFCAC